MQFNDCPFCALSNINTCVMLPKFNKTDQCCHSLQCSKQTHSMCIVTNYEEIHEVDIKDKIISTGDILTLCFKFQLMHMFQKMALHLLSGFPLTTKT